MSIRIGIGTNLRIQSGFSWSAYWATRTPSGLILTVLSDTSIKVDWTDAAQAADGLHVYFGGILKDTVAYGVGTSTVIGLTAGMEYTISVVAYKGTHESNALTNSVYTWSTESVAYFNAVEAEPSGVVEDKDSTNIEIIKSVDESFYDDIVFWTNIYDFGRNFFFSMSAAYYVVKLVGSDIWITDINGDPYSQLGSDPIIMGGAVAQEFEGAEEDITMTEDTIIEGDTVGTWFGNGTIINRTFEDVKRIITQVVTVGEKLLTIENNIEYKTSLKIEFEGFKFTGNIYLDKFKNVMGSGTGQNIIGEEGMFFHHGFYTPFRIITGGDRYLKWKQYEIGNKERTVLHFMDGEIVVPAKILMQPNGFNSSFTISNHPDSAIFTRQKAIHFGASDLIFPSIKGLSSRGIISDWAVFAKPEAGVASFIDDTDYLNFLLLLKSLGNEIIPHTVSNSPGNRADAITYLPEYKNNFIPSTWTDHSVTELIESLAISSKGWDVTDDINYILDLFESNGFNKIWSFQNSEKDRIVKSIWGFNHDIAYYNDSLKLPSSGNFILLWKASNRPFHDGWLDVNNLVENCGAVDSHDYLAHSNREAGGDTDDITYTHYLSGGIYYITTGFDNLLAEIASAKSSGTIWNPSNTEWCNYFKKLKLVQVEYEDQDTIKVNNEGEIISGFTMLLCKASLTPKLNGVNMTKKSASKGTICWADLPVGESIISY